MERREVGVEHKVALRRCDMLAEFYLALHADGVDGFGNAQALVLEAVKKERRRHRLAARRARHVGHEAGDIGHAMALQPLFQFLEVHFVRLVERAPE